jgi:hypothetical protein
MNKPKVNNALQNDSLEVGLDILWAVFPLAT